MRKYHHLGNYPIINTILFIVILVTNPVHLVAQDSMRVTFPSTRISIIPPPCYKLVEKLPLLFCEKTNVTLTIVESTKPPEDIFSSYSDPVYLAERDFEEISRPEEIMIDSVWGMRFNIRKRSGLLTNRTEISRIFVVGDSLGTFTAIINYSDTILSSVVEPLVTSIYTIRWNRAKALNPMDVLGFSITPPNEMKMAYEDAHCIVYTPNGMLPERDIPTPRFTLSTIRGPSSLEYFPIEARKKMMESIIANSHPDIKISQVMEFNKTFFDGVSAFESVSSGKWLPTGSTIAVYYTLIFHPGDLITIAGLADTIQTDKYINSYKEAASSFHRRSVIIEEHMECAALLNSRNYIEATSCFNQILLQNPGSLSALLGKAEALRLQGKHTRAIEEYTHVLENERFCEKALIGRARSLVALEKWSDAIQDFNIALELNGNNVSIYIERAEVRIKSHDTYSAQEDYKQAIEIFSDSSELYVALGNLQPIDEAVKTYTKAIEIDKSNGLAYKARARCHFWRSNYTKALADIDIALQFRPQDKELYALRGTVNSNLGKFEEALSDLARGPENALIFSQRAFLNGLIRRVDASMNEFSRSIQLDSTDWMTYFLKGIINYLNGSFRDACTDLRKAATRSPSAEVRAWLFFSEVKMYNWERAKKNLSSYYSTSASMTEDWHEIVKFLLGKVDEEQLIHNIKPFQENTLSVTEEQRLNDAKCDTYFAIGMKNHATGLKVGAKPYWKKCLGTKRDRLISYQVADALINGAWNK